MIPLWQASLSTGQATGVTLSFSSLCPQLLSCDFGLFNLLLPQFPHLKTMKAIVFLTELLRKLNKLRKLSELYSLLLRVYNSKTVLTWFLLVFLNCLDEMDLPCWLPLFQYSFLPVVMIISSLNIHKSCKSMPFSVHPQYRVLRLPCSSPYSPGCLVYWKGWVILPTPEFL